MIIQSLSGYYRRMADRPESDIPRPGFCHQSVHYALTLGPDGELLGAPIQLGSDTEPMVLTLPIDSGGTSGVASKFLWGNSAYVLGYDPSKKKERVEECFDDFRKLHQTIGKGVDDAGMRALLLFLDRWRPEMAVDLLDWEKIGKKGGNFVFRLDGERAFLHDRRTLQDAWAVYWRRSWSTVLGMCLVEGRSGVPIARTHARIKGVPGAQPSGAALISFNIDAFNSYGKSQNFNAPVGEEAAFAYTAALNDLLAKKGRRNVRMGDTVCLFWTEEDARCEDFMAGFIDPSLFEGESDALLHSLRIFLESVRKGIFPGELGEAGGRFFILGLAPNAGRISVRFFHVDRTDAVALSIGRHYRDLEIISSFPGDPPFPSPFQILRATAVRRKGKNIPFLLEKENKNEKTADRREGKNIPPLLSGHLMRAILTGCPYPRTLFSALMGGIRSDQSVSYIRAAAIKAILIRNHQMEVTFMLDQETKENAYCLGRLFATVEKAQEEAVPAANATVRDRFFSSASAMPGRVFPVLMRSVQHSLSKLRKGEDMQKRATHFDRLIGEIVGKIDCFPKTLSLEEQGRFAIGYYHQRKDFFTSRKEIDQKKGGESDDSNQ